MRWLWVIVVGALCVWPCPVTGDGWTVGGTVRPTVTLTGAYVGVVADVSKGAHSFSAGPVASLTNASLPHRTNLGLQLAWRVDFSTGRWATFAQPLYQVVLPEPLFSNHVHELLWTYGLEYRVGDHLAIGNALGLGVVVESYATGPGRLLLANPNGVLLFQVRYVP